MYVDVTYRAIQGKFKKSKSIDFNQQQLYMTYFDIQASMHSYKLRCPAFCLIYCRMNVNIIDFIYTGVSRNARNAKEAKKKQY